MFDVAQRVILREFAVSPVTWVVVNRTGIAVVLLPLAVRPGLAGRVPGGAQTDSGGPGLLARLRGDATGFALAGALNVLLVYFGGLAFASLPASIASTVVNAQSIVAVLLGAALLGDTAFGRRLAGACLAIAGIGAIALG